MKLRIAASALVLSLSLVATGSLHAAPAPSMFHSSGDVKFSVRNDSQAPVTLKAGDQQVTLRPGQTQKLNLPQGTQVMTTDATGNHGANEVLGTVNDTLKGNTLVVK